MSAPSLLGSIRLDKCIAEDPFGTIHQGFEIDRSQTERAVMVRLYHSRWLDLGLSDRQPEIRRNLLHLSHLRSFRGCRFAQDGLPHLAWPLLKGRNLKQVLNAAETQELPFGLDQALFVVWSLAHHISLLERVHLPVGFLAPHRIWVGFDGLIQLLDTPVISALTQLLPGDVSMPQELASYLQGPPQEGLPHTSFQLGLLLFEMLTHHPMPLQEGIPDFSDLAITHSDGHSEVLPQSVQVLMNRLFGTNPYPSLRHMEEDLEQLLFGGDYNPTTFGLAFTMHTLFRRDLEREEDEALQAALDQFDDPSEIPFGKPRAPRKHRKWMLSLAGSALAATALFAARHWSIHPASTHPSAFPTLPSGSSTVASPAQNPAPSSAETQAPEDPPTPARESKPQPTREARIDPIPVRRAQESRTEVPVIATPSRAQALLPTAPASPASVASKIESKPQSSHEPPKLQSILATQEGVPVRLQVYVDELGRARQAHVVQGALPGTNQERTAYLIAMQARFTPAQNDGHAVRDWIEITVRVK